MEKKSFSGFTLVETMIVVGIIAFLAVIAILYFRGQSFKGNDAKRKADIKRIQIAVEEYEKDNNCYPEFVTCNQDDDTQAIHPYLNTVPCDPTTNTSYSYEYSGSCPGWYRIYTKLQNLSDEDVINGIGQGGAYNYYSGSPNAPIITGPSQGSGQQDYFGCKNGVLVPVAEGECENSFPSSGFSGACQNADGSPANECQAP